jgi:hypothetical protein
VPCLSNFDFGIAQHFLNKVRGGASCNVLLGSMATNYDIDVIRPTTSSTKVHDSSMRVLLPKCLGKNVVVHFVRFYDLSTMGNEWQVKFLFVQETTSSLPRHNPWY